jgi:SET domain-containing protein
VIKYRLIVAYGEHGRGVFTLEDIPAGDLIEVAPVIDVPAESIPGLSDYTYGSWNEDMSRLAFGYGSLYAHSFTPNVVVEHGATCLSFLAVRDIVAGEELCHNYGLEWWKGRGVEPRGGIPAAAEGEGGHPGGPGEDRSEDEVSGGVG